MHIMTNNFNLIVNLTNDDFEIENLYKQNINNIDDSGFDLYVAKDTYFNPNESTKLVPLGIRCCPKFNSGYYLYPRSSIFKTQFRLANSVGIIDKNYRGEIKAAIDAINLTSEVLLKKGTRICQLCHPSLQPMMVTFVDEFEEYLNTDRGTGGFGSTGL